MAKQLFFVTALTNPEGVKEKIAEVIQDPSKRYELAPDKWVVYADGPPGDLADKLGIRNDPHIGTGLVLTFGSYGGRAPSSLWEWIKAQTE
ncbi:hypothetical protein [Paraburkholderia tropica]|uniref:hypothetical protein n=1 Tax=Paraburkholderia tropica TaxID=92647 RepID=UPI002AB7CB2D|nr:hypothetical protein [Paraburkholderia tropica]